MSGLANAPPPPSTPNRPPGATPAAENAASSAQSDSTDPTDEASANRSPSVRSDRAAEDGGATDQAASDTGPVLALRPGDVGYAPPARVANVAGDVLKPEHYGWDPGRSSTNMRGMVPLAMPAPAYETVTNDTQIVPPSMLTAPTANARLAKMIGDMSAWVHDFPHLAHGKSAVVLRFFRDLEARSVARGTASHLGRSYEPDAIDQAYFVPPVEYFRLRHLAEQMTVMHGIYTAALSAQGVSVSEQDQATVDKIMAEFAPLADGPKSPASVPTSDPTSGGPDAPENHENTPRSDAKPASRSKTSSQPQTDSSAAD